MGSYLNRVSINWLSAISTQRLLGKILICRWLTTSNSLELRQREKTKEQKEILELCTPFSTLSRVIFTMRQKQFPKQRQSNRKSRFSTEFTRIIFTDDYTAARFGGHSSPLYPPRRSCNLTILLFLHRCQFYVFHCGANSVPLPFAPFSTCNKRRKKVDFVTHFMR